VSCLVERQSTPIASVERGCVTEYRVNSKHWAQPAVICARPHNLQADYQQCPLCDTAHAECPRCMAFRMFVCLVTIAIGSFNELSSPRRLQCTCESTIWPECRIMSRNPPRLGSWPSCRCFEWGCDGRKMYSDTPRSGMHSIVSSGTVMLIDVPPESITKWHDSPCCVPAPYRAIQNRAARDSLELHAIVLIIQSAEETKHDVDHW